MEVMDIFNLYDFFFFLLLTTNHIIIKCPYKARSDWLKKRALPENRKRVQDFKLAFRFCFGILTNLTQIKHSLRLRQTQCKRVIVSSN